MSDAVPLTVQIAELELACLGARAAINRVRSNELRRSPEWVERREARLAALEAVLATLRKVQKGETV